MRKVFESKKVIVSKVGAVALAMVMSFGMTGATSSVEAAAKKLTVNKVYNTTTKVKGKTKGKYQVRITIGKKTYMATASKKGNYSVKIPKQKVGKKYYVKAYKKSGKKWKYYTKKRFYVITSKLKVNKPLGGTNYVSGYAKPGTKVTIKCKAGTKTVKASKTSGYFKATFKKAIGNSKVSVTVKTTSGKKVTSTKVTPVKKPGKTDAIDLKQFYKDLETYKKTGKIIDKDQGLSGEKNRANSYFYSISGSNIIGDCYRIGYIHNYMKTEANGAWAKFKAMDGITLYGNVEYSFKNTVKEPTTTDYDFKVTSGHTKTYKGSDFKADDAARCTLSYKVKGYKNGKLVMMMSDSQYIIGGWRE